MLPSIADCTGTIATQKSSARSTFLFILNCGTFPSVSADEIAGSAKEEPGQEQDQEDATQASERPELPESVETRATRHENYHEDYQQNHGLKCILFAGRLFQQAPRDIKTLGRGRNAKKRSYQ